VEPKPIISPPSRFLSPAKYFSCYPVTHGYRLFSPITSIISHTSLRCEAEVQDNSSSSIPLLRALIIVPGVPSMPRRMINLIAFPSNRCELLYLALPHRRQRSHLKVFRIIHKNRSPIQRLHPMLNAEFGRSRQNTTMIQSRLSGTL
jgi:hypothetical protein